MKILKSFNNKSFMCPTCNMSAMYCKTHNCRSNADVNWHDVFSCSNCGSRFLSEPTREGHIRFVDTICSASNCLDDFDLNWKENFGPDSTTVMSLNEFDQYMKEVIDFDGEC